MRSVDDEPRFVVGMDAHAHKLAVLIWDWSDRLNAHLHRGVKCVDVDAMVKTYERHVDFDPITVIETPTGSEALSLRRGRNRQCRGGSRRRQASCCLVSAANRVFPPVEGRANGHE